MSVGRISKSISWAVSLMCKEIKFMVRICSDIQVIRRSSSYVLWITEEYVLPFEQVWVARTHNLGPSKCGYWVHGIWQFFAQSRCEKYLYVCCKNLNVKRATYCLLFMR